MSDPTPKVTSAHHGVWPNDQAIWLMFFTAALSGVGREKSLKEVLPKTIAKRCAKIADAALEEEKTRRQESK